MYFTVFVYWNRYEEIILKSSFATYYRTEDVIKMLL